MKICTNTSKQQSKKQKFREWSDKVRQRDNGECQICGKTYMINAHHIIPRQFKDYAYNTDNGISLCPKHHKFSRVISAHNNPFAFIVWLQKHRPNQFAIVSEWNRKIQERFE